MRFNCHIRPVVGVATCVWVLARGVAPCYLQPAALTCAAIRADTRGIWPCHFEASEVVVRTKRTQPVRLLDSGDTHRLLLLGIYKLFPILPISVVSPEYPQKPHHGCWRLGPPG